MGPQPAYLVETSNLVRTNPLRFTLTCTVHGVTPDDYDFTIIQDPTTASFDVKHLLTGMLYYLRASSITDKGVSLPMDSVPIAIAPRGVPGKISPLIIRPLNEATLLVSFEASAEANGAHVEEYIIDSSSHPDFSERTRIQVQPNH